jgi:hypothetical protein
MLKLCTLLMLLSQIVLWRESDSQDLAIDDIADAASRFPASSLRGFGPYDFAHG